MESLSQSELDELLREARSASDLFEGAMRLKQDREFAKAKQVLHFARTKAPDAYILTRISTQLMFAEERTTLSSLRALFGYDFFISHAHADARPYAEALRDALKGLRYKCFLDKSEAPAGAELTDALRTGLVKSAAMLVIGSPKSLGAAYVAQEISAFAFLGRPIIPIDVGGTLSGPEWQQYRRDQGIPDYIRASEAAEAFSAAKPSAQVVDAIERLFKLRRRSTVQRFVVASTAAAVLAAVGVAQYQNMQARRAARIDRANQIVFLGERIVDDEPALAIGLAMQSADIIEVPAAATLVRRAVRLLPERMRVVVDPKASSSGPKVLTDFTPLSDLCLGNGGSVLFALDKKGVLQVFSVESAKQIARFGDGTQVAAIGTYGAFSDRLLILFANGVLEEYRTVLGTRLSLEKTWPGTYMGIAPLDGTASALAWQEGGSLVFKAGREQKRFTVPRAVRAAAIGESANAAAILLEDGALITVDFKDGARVPGPVVKLDTGDVKIEFIEPMRAAVIVERRASDVVEAVHVVVADLASRVTALDRTERGNEVAVDRAGGKLAWLSSVGIEQMELSRDHANDALNVQRSQLHPQWSIEPMERDVGEARQVIYGPFGEYLLSLNAPILQSVGAYPGEIKLWYANAFSDDRAGDPHRGLKLASRNQAVLNAAFDRSGSRLAAFFEDGTVRVWDILPERFIGTGLKASDVFEGISHIGLVARALLNVPETEVSHVLQVARGSYGVRIPESVRSELTSRLTRGESLGSLAQKLFEYRTAMAALQSHNERVEVKRWTTGDDEVTYALEQLANEIVRDVGQSIPPDETAIRVAYFEILRRQPLLLAGLGLPTRNAAEWQDMNPELRTRQCVLLALSGDTSAMNWMHDRLAPSSEADRVCAWSRDFLQRTGRDLSIDGPLAKGPTGDSPIVMLPEPWLVAAWTEGLIPCGAALSGNEPGDDVLVPPGAGVGAGLKKWSTIKCASISRQRAERVCRAVTESDAPSFATLAVCAVAAKNDGYGGRLNLATQLRDKGRHSAALLWAQDLLSVTTDQRNAGSAENFYGYVLHLMSKDADALSHYTRAIEQGRPDGWPERNMAESLAVLDRHAEADNYFKKAIAKVEALIEKAAASSNGQTMLSQMGEEIGGFYNAYAWYLVTRRSATAADGTRAIDLARIACDRTDNRNANFLDTLAHAHALSGDACKALDVQNQTMRLAELRRRVEGSLTSIEATWLRSASRSKGLLIAVRPPIVSRGLSQALVALAVEANSEPEPYSGVRCARRIRRRFRSALNDAHAALDGASRRIRAPRGMRGVATCHLWQPSRQQMPRPISAPCWTRPSGSP